MTVLNTKLDQLPSNIQIVNSNGFPTTAFVFYLLKMFQKSQSDNQNFSSLLAEINAVETGAGLSADGTYVPDLTSHYISTASSLFIADILIDMAIHNLQTEVNSIEDGAGLNMDGTYSPNTTSNYLSASTSLYNADMLLDSKLYSVVNRIISINTNYMALVGNYSIIADATSGTITVTLPLASTATSLIIGITKTDTTVNAVNIIRSGADLICGSTSQSLLYQNEVLNFISDGTNWQLAN
jgi:hypothetical protein